MLTAIAYWGLATRAPESLETPTLLGVTLASAGGSSLEASMPLLDITPPKTNREPKTGPLKWTVLYKGPPGGVLYQLENPEGSLRPREGEAP